MPEQHSLRFGDVLRYYRRSAGLTQEELAERANLSVRGIRDLENNVRLPRKDTAQLLADALTRADELDLSAEEQAKVRAILQAAARREKRMLADASQPPPQAEEPVDVQPSSRALAEDLTPFVAGPPIRHPRQFFGSDRELKRLFTLWKRPPLQNAAIIGRRRSGKTSLLLYLKHITRTPVDELRPEQQASWLEDPGRYRWIFVDFQDPRLGTREGLLRYLLTALELPVPETPTLGDFLEMVSRHVTSPTLILFDEIDMALKRYPELDDPFWEAFRSLATTQVDNNLAFVLAADESPARLAQHCHLGSPFFNIFGYTAVLGPLSEPEARELMGSSPIPFPSAESDWILAQSGRWPLLLQILCRECLSSLEEGDRSGDWRAEGLRQIEDYRSLLEIRHDLPGRSTWSLQSI